MIEICNATQSGMPRRGAYHFEIEEDENDFFFTYKMTNGGFVSGLLDIVHKKEINAVWNSDDYHTYTKLILLANDKLSGTLSFLKEDFYLQVPFTVCHLSLDRDKTEYFDFYKRKEV